MVRGDLVNRLRGLGLTRRKAELVLNQLIDAMKSALQKGEEIELPFGTLAVVRHARSKKRGWYLNKIATVYKNPFTVVLRRDR